MKIWTDKLVKSTCEAAFSGDKVSQKEIVNLINELRWHLADQAQSLMEPNAEIDALLGEETEEEEIEECEDFEEC